MKNALLYFGSFNPIHRGHIALAEYAVEQGLCDEVILVVSPQNPHKATADLAPELMRFEMAEKACAASRFPEKIKPSVIEFMLERPSYTINTLRYLTENFGSEMHFSILMGCDLINTLDRWKEWEEILANYPILVYPRRGCEVEKFQERITYLKDAPLCDFSSTEVREAVERGGNTREMLLAEVADYIREKNLYTTSWRILSLNAALEQDPQNARLLLERGSCQYRSGSWGDAINDFNRCLEIEPDNQEAKQLKEMVYEILSYRYTDIYNP